MFLPIWVLRVSLPSSRSVLRIRLLWKTPMFAIIGIIVVIVAILGGYLMEHGSVRVLIQPAELLIDGGAAGGTVLIANPLHIVKQIATGIGLVFKGSQFTNQLYVELLQLTYGVSNTPRMQGVSFT